LRPRSLRRLTTLVFAALLAGSANAEWPRHTIDASSRGADGVRLADINGDGHADIATGWEEGGLVRAYIHPGPAAVHTGKWTVATVGPAASVEDAVFADLDGDGRMDVVSSCEGKTKTVFVHWGQARTDAEAPLAWQAPQAFPKTKGQQAWMFALPMKRADGRTDVVVASKGGGACIGLLEAPPAGDRRDLTRWRFRRLVDATWVMSLRSVDVDRDGDADIVASNRKGDSARVLWLENRPDGTWPEHVIGSSGRENMFLDVHDMNGDGRLDVLVSRKPHEVVLLTQAEDPRDRWAESVVKLPTKGYGTAKAVAAGDLDVDGTPELVLTCESANGAKIGCFFAKQTAGRWTFLDISGEPGTKFDRIELLDLDADGDLDVLTCEERDGLGVFWYENPHNRSAP